MTVTQTSRDAYNSTVAARGTIAEQILQLVRGRGESITRAEIADQMEMEKSSVSGRVNELIKSGKLKVANTVTCRVTGRRVQAVFPTA